MGEVIHTFANSEILKLIFEFRQTTGISLVNDHYKYLIPPLTEIASFSTKYFILSKVYTDDSGIKQLYHGF